MRTPSTLIRYQLKLRRDTNQPAARSTRTIACWADLEGMAVADMLMCIKDMVASYRTPWRTGGCQHTVLSATREALRFW